MNKTKFIASSLALLVLTMESGTASSNSQPSNFNYHQISLYKVQLDVDAIEDYKGYELFASYDIKPNFALYGKLQSSDISINAEFAPDFDATMEIIEFGSIYHKAINSKGDINIHLSLEKRTLDASTRYESDIRKQTAVVVGFGLRHKATNNLEINSKFELRNKEYNNYLFELGAQYALTPKFSLQANISHGEDYDILRAGMRYYFK